ANECSLKLGPAADESSEPEPFGHRLGATPDRPAGRPTADQRPAHRDHPAGRSSHDCAASTAPSATRRSPHANSGFADERQPVIEATNSGGCSGVNGRRRTSDRGRGVKWNTPGRRKPGRRVTLRSLSGSELLANDEGGESDRSATFESAHRGQFWFGRRCG